MTVRPIIFSAPMVRALLEGRKTQTRRILRGAWQQALSGHDKVKTFFAPSNVPQGGIENVWAPSGIWAEKHGARGYNRHLGFSPYRPGDLLYVREAGYFAPNRVAYAATNETLSHGERVEGFGRLRPSIHMPRWASRLTLAVTDVRVQRLNEISEEDAQAEGVEPLSDWSTPYGEAFARLWNTIHGSGAWDQNPWVVAITFTVHKVNVDQFVETSRDRNAA